MSFPEPRFLSTAVSDFVLAASAFSCAVNVHVVSQYAAGGFVLIGCAAVLGVFRFGVVFPGYHNTVIRYHMFLSWLASVVGLPLIAAGFCMCHHKHNFATFQLVSGATGFGLSMIHPPLDGILSQVCSTLAVLGIMFITYLDLNYYGVGGGMAYAVSGAVKVVDSFAGLRGVDLFHYALVVGNTLLMYGLLS